MKEKIHSFAFMEQVFPLLEQISLWKSFYSAWLRFLAFGAGGLCFVVLVHGMRKLFEFPFWMSVGLSLFNVGIGLTGYMLVHLLWNRANSVAHLQEDTYPILRISSHLVRLVGEILAVCAFGLWVSAGVAILFAGNGAARFTYGIGVFDFGNNPFIDGSLTIIAGMGYAVMCILAGRMVYEMMVILIDVAESIRKIRVMMASNMPPKKQEESQRKTDIAA